MVPMKSCILAALLFIICFHATSAISGYNHDKHHPFSFKQGIGPLASMKSYIPHPTSDGAPRPSTLDCSVHWYDQTIDHFSSSSSANLPSSSDTFKQRYFVNTAYWSGPAKHGPILVYTGNEANVELYVNATGFMWENAQSLNAALVFIEHRYYGQSLPFISSQEEDMIDDERLAYLTVEQALEDYASIITHIKQSWKAKDSPVVVLGGSYGGMLAAWLRMKYPHIVDGAIASSAPLLAFDDTGSVSPLSSFGHGETYWQVVTSDASEQGGSAPECSSNVRLAFQALFRLGAESSSSSKGLETLTDIFRLCRPLQRLDDVQTLALMYLNAWDSMAMGNYPFPSNYLIFQQTNDVNVKLPAFPVRAACEYMRGNFHRHEDDIKGDYDINSNDVALLSALRNAGGVYYNATGTTTCFDLPDDVNFDGIWDYQYCTELLPQETYFARDGVNDMFWSFDLNKTSIKEHCLKSFPHLSSSSAPRWEWMKDMYEHTDTLTNVVFTNGNYDPWSAGGIMPPGLSSSDSVAAFIIDEGAHHLDLMFSNVEHDPLSVVKIRKIEVEYVLKWVAQKNSDELSEVKQ